MAKPKAPEGETAQQKFERIAGSRVNTVVAGLEVLAQSGKDCPGDAYTTQAFAMIRAKVDAAETAWRDKLAVGRPKVFGFATPETRQTEMPQSAAPPPPAAPTGKATQPQRR